MSILTFDMVQLRAFERIEQQMRNAERTIKRNTLKRAAKAIIARDVQLVSQQTDITGQPFAPKKQASRRKMFSRLVRKIAVKSQSENDVLIGFNNAVSANIASRQNTGFTEHFTRSQFARSARSRASADAPATRQQAKALLQAGFKYKRGHGSPWLTPTIKWIVGNLKIGQAGLILRRLRGARDEWTTVIPARQFFGIPADLLPELTNIALNEAQNVLNAH